MAGLGAAQATTIGAAVRGVGVGRCRGLPGARWPAVQQKQSSCSSKGVHAGGCRSEARRRAAGVAGGGAEEGATRSEDGSRRQRRASGRGARSGAMAGVATGGNGRSGQLRAHPRADARARGSATVSEQREAAGGQARTRACAWGKGERRRGWGAHEGCVGFGQRGSRRKTGSRRGSSGEAVAVRGGEVTVTRSSGGSVVTVGEADGVRRRNGGAGQSGDGGAASGFGHRRQARG
nr:spidroin-1-like [Aegilops tauschii subsp. strangulata]